MSFKDKAVSNTQKNFFNLTEGLEKIDVADIIKTFPEGITIDGVSLTLNKKKKTEVAVFTAKEIPGKFFFGGVVLTDLANTWNEDYNDFKKCTEALKEEGGVKLRLFTVESKTGNSYTAYEVL